MYKTKQTGWVIIILVVIVEIIQMMLFRYYGDQLEGPGIIIYTTAIAFIILLLLFHHLEVKVDQNAVKISFGIGLIRKKIPLSNIKKTEAVRNKSWYGWGIHYTPHGWLWNIGGFQAVEITYKDSGKKFRVGTKDAKHLKEEIDKRL